jgi:hypothetical protein
MYRADAARLLVLALERHDSAWTSWASPSFTDVGRPPEQIEGYRYPFDFVEELVAGGMEPPGGEFRPWHSIRRGDLACWLASASEARLPPALTALPFKDLEGLPATERVAIGRVWAGGLLQGTRADSFSPHSDASRGAIALATWRLLRLLGRAT